MIVYMVPFIQQMIMLNCIYSQMEVFTSLFSAF